MAHDIGWSTARIAEFAPDAASVAAARRLGPDLSGTGWHSTLLWGKCSGSAAQPYEIVVDVAGPAFSCTCPSRKRPCKHVLALVIAWSEDAVAEYDSAPPGIATPQATPTRAAGTPDPATALRRAERVSAGLEDLDTWLLDQVRNGLAQADRAAQGFEVMAARMVDAQAPGIASTLRRIPYTIAAHDDWPVRVLATYAQLRLLITAHRKLDSLPAPLQASVRAHVGYPMKADAVLAQPPIRDRWMVLGSRVTDEDQLYTRRVWLRGRETHRWAVLLDFSYGIPEFISPVPEPGTLVAADVHHYPGAAEVRAKLGARQGDSIPFTTLPADTVAHALRDFATAVGADPWTRTWPALLGDVVPVVHGTEWRLVDREGVAVRMSGDDSPWTLLGISGGYPITVLGEWNGTALAPVSAFTEGQVVML